MAAPTTTSSDARFRPAGLIAFATGLLTNSGLSEDRAHTVAALLVEADLLGHTTHRLALLPAYLQQISIGGMAVSGEPKIISDRGAAIVWDGGRLPGVWLTSRAVAVACERARAHGLAGVSIRNGHHIGGLAVFLEGPARNGLAVIIASSDPSVKGVAPYGGTAPLITPNPLAAGIPTDGDPILIDISASIATLGLADRLRGAGQKFPAAWAIDAAGNPTDDPAVLTRDPPGTILPVGGIDHGHKGYALGLLVEVLTQVLSGFGRADPPAGWGASVWVQVLDPAMFAGREAFMRQTSWLANACRANPPRPGLDSVRLPGEQGLRRKRAALIDGLQLHPGILDALQPWAERFDADLLLPIGEPTQTEGPV
ncbi:MAG: Ldh family oxidoreductase [Acetobacteraceae bacterium]|nr:Ldh family oxidoreductase [Acetobacteraceae bacterium]